MQYEEQYLGLIIETYEKALIKSGSVRAYKVLSLRGVNDLKSITSTTRKAIDSFPGSAYDLEANPELADVKSTKTVSSDLLKKMNIPLAPEALNDYIEKCFDCDLRLKWDWQFLPPDVTLDVFGQMLDDMKAVIDTLKGAFSSKKILKQLCALPTLFNGIPCPQDILSIIFALKILLGKYQSGALKIKFDWFSLLGGIVSALVNALTYLVNLIFDAIVIPLNCLISGMSSGLDVLRVLNDEFSTPFFKKDIGTSAKTETSTRNTDRTILGQSTSQTTNTSIITDIDDSIGIDAKISQSIQYKSLASSSDGTSVLAVPSGTITGFTVNMFHTNTDPNRSGWIDLSLPEQILVTLIEAREFIAYYRNKIIDCSSALRGLVSGSKLLDIQNMSILISIADLLSLFVSLIGTDIRTICDFTRKDDLEVFVNKLISDSDDSATVSIVTGDKGQLIAKVVESDQISEVELKVCTSANTKADISKVKNILEEIERITRNG